MRAAVEAIEEEHGALGALVNNAGYSQTGALETLPMELVRRQFETNVFGALRLAQLALPGMRRQGWGRIVNVSSMGGRLTLPGAGAYHSAKHALEALSDALRYEVAGFGVDVVVVEPGLVRTRYGEAAARSAEDLPEGDRPYAEFDERVARTTLWAYAHAARLVGAPPETVARTIDEALSARRPRTRYRVTASGRALIATRRLLPDRAWDAMLRLAYPHPGARS